MRLYMIAVQGDNDKLHDQALKDAVSVIEHPPGHSKVYRAWTEPVSPDDVDRQLRRRELVRTDG